MLAPGGEVDALSPLLRMALSSLEQYPGFVAELQEISEISIDYQRCGAIEVALSSAEADALEDRAFRQQALGIHSESITYNGSVSARFFPGDQLVDPRTVTAALGVACLRAGVRIYQNQPVMGIRPDGSGVMTQSGEYRDEGVLIAAGAWSSALLPGLPATMPVRGHLVSYDTNRKKLLDTILRHNGTYLLQRRGGALVAGSSTEHVGFDREIDESIVADIGVRASRLLPALAGSVPISRWNGFRPAVSGEEPVIGRIHGTSIWTAFGHYRNGILLAPETARMIVELVG